MMGWLRLLRDGRALRHLPVAYSDNGKAEIRVVLSGPGHEPVDVTYDHVPASLQPLILAIRSDVTLNQGQSLALYDAFEEVTPLARLELRRVGELELGRGSIQLFHPTSCQNRCVAPPIRWYRYALAWRHAARARDRGESLLMSAADLIALNAYYIVARPVYLVSVAHKGLNNLFPMDLVGRISSGEFILALRATSPAVPLIEESRHVAMSAAPSNHKQTVYALGAHHRLKSIELATLPFRMTNSQSLGLPVLHEAEVVIEIEIREVHRVGSHVLFIGSILNESGVARNQLAHVSGMYAEWLRRHGRPMRGA